MPQRETKQRKPNDSNTTDSNTTKTNTTKTGRHFIMKHLPVFSSLCKVADLEPLCNSACIAVVHHYIFNANTFVGDGIHHDYILTECTQLRVDECLTGLFVGKNLVGLISPAFK